MRPCPTGPWRAGRWVKRTLLIRQTHILQLLITLRESLHWSQTSKLWNLPVTIVLCLSLNLLKRKILSPISASLGLYCHDSWQYINPPSIQLCIRQQASPCEVLGGGHTKMLAPDCHYLTHNWRMWQAQSPGSQHAPQYLASFRDQGSRRPCNLRDSDPSGYGTLSSSCALMEDSFRTRTLWDKVKTGGCYSWPTNAMPHQATAQLGGQGRHESVPGTARRAAQTLSTVIWQE